MVLVCASRPCASFDECFLVKSYDGTIGTKVTPAVLVGTSIASEWKTFGAVSGAVPAEAQCAAVVPQERRELKMIAFNSVLIILNNKSLNSQNYFLLNSWKEDHFVAQVTMTVAPASRAWRKPSWASPDKSTWASTWVPAKIQEGRIEDDLLWIDWIMMNHKVFFSISDEKPIHNIFMCWAQFAKVPGNGYHGMQWDIYIVYIRT